MKLRALVPLLFWITFSLSILLASFNAWLRTVWGILLVMSLVSTSLSYLFGVIKNPQLRTSRGYPKWFLRFAYDDQSELANESERNRI